MSVGLSLELFLMLLVLVSHDVQNGISYDFNFVRWPLHFLPVSCTHFVTELPILLQLKVIKPIFLQERTQGRITSGIGSNL